jgi:hypothetical protein
MKSLLAIVTALVIAAAGGLWFATKPVLVTARLESLKPNPDMPTFKRVPQ